MRLWGQEDYSVRFRVLFAVAALLALTTFCFGQDPAQVAFIYPGADFDCNAHAPLSYGPTCFQGTPIPDGALIEFYKNGAPFDPPLTFPINSEFICGTAIGGFFYTDYLPGYLAGDHASIHVVYQGCHYWTADYLLDAGVNAIELVEANWTCSCANPGCDVKDEQSGMLLNGSKAKESPGSPK
jgi:hypothetical protein